MESQDSVRRRKTVGWVLGGLGVLLVILIAVSSQSHGRSKSELACGHFANVSHDAAVGILSDAELRPKLKEVYDDAIIATPEVRSASQAVLAAVTQGDNRALGPALDRLSTACEKATD